MKPQASRPEPPEQLNRVELALGFIVLIILLTAVVYAFPMLAGQP